MPPKFADYETSSSDFTTFKSVFHIPCYWETIERDYGARRSLKQQMILGCSVQAIFSQEADWLTDVATTENSRLQMHLMNGRSVEFLCDEAKFEDSDWEITVDMWATSITGDKIHLRTLIEERKDGLDMWGSELGGMVTTFFTPTEEETSLNNGGQGFYFTCIVQSTSDSARRDPKPLT